MMIAASLVAKDLTTEISELRDELRRAQTDLRRSDESRRVLVDLASRELRTPITLLLGYARLLENESSEITKGYAKVISNNARQLKNAVALLITLQRIDAGDLVLRTDRICLAEVIQDAVASRRRELDEKELSIHVDVDDGVLVKADREQLFVMVTQVLSHAIRRTAPRQVIFVDARVRTFTAIVTVRSRASGPVADHSAAPVDRFRAANEGAGRDDGLELTLLATKALAELHGGTLWQGNSDGAGSDISFSLPRTDAPPQVTRVKGQSYRSPMRTAAF